MKPLVASEATDFRRLDRSEDSPARAKYRMSSTVSSSNGRALFEADMAAGRWGCVCVCVCVWQSVGFCFFIRYGGVGGVQTGTVTRGMLGPGNYGIIRDAVSRFWRTSLAFGSGVDFVIPPEPTNPHNANKRNQESYRKRRLRGANIFLGGAST